MKQLQKLGLLLGAFLLAAMQTPLKADQLVEAPFDDSVVNRSSVSIGAGGLNEDGIEAKQSIGSVVGNVVRGKNPLTQQQQNDLAKTVNQGKLIKETADEALKVTDLDEVKKNTVSLWGGLKKMGSGLKTLACGTRDELINVAQGVSGGTQMAIAAAKQGAALGLDTYDYLRGQEGANTARATALRDSATEFQEKGKTDIKAALARTPAALKILGEGLVETGFGTFEVIQAGKPLYDAAVEIAPYVATACAIVAAV